MNQIEKIIDIATWNRKEHFEHFSAFDDPFFGVTVNVDCTRAYREAKNKGVSFSLLLLHRIITAAAKVEEFRYRIEGEKVVCYDSLLPEATVGRADHTFSFASFEYDPDELTFILKAKAEMERLQTTTGLNKEGTFHPNAIHYSAVPWQRTENIHRKILSGRGEVDVTYFRHLSPWVNGRLSCGKIHRIS